MSFSHREKHIFWICCSLWLDTFFLVSRLPGLKMSLFSQANRTSCSSLSGQQHQYWAWRLQLYWSSTVLQKLSWSVPWVKARRDQPACVLCTGDFVRWFRDHAAGRCRPPPGSASHQDSGSPGQDHSHVPGPERRPGPAHTFQRIFPINFLYFTRRWRKGYNTPQRAASFVLENKSLWPKTLKVQHSPCLSMELQQ